MPEISDRTLTMRDVAQRAQVSVSLVSSYINTPHLVGAQSQKKIEAAIRELNWVPNAAARQLRSGLSSMVAFVAYDISDPLFAAVSRGAQEAARTSALSLVLADTDGDAEEESHYISLFVEQRVRGLLVSPVELSEQVRSQLTQSRLPVVLVDSPPPDSSFWSLSVDDVLGGRLAVAHLLDVGRRRVTVIGGPLSVRQVADRLAGARDAVSGSTATIDFMPTTGRDIDAGRMAASAILSMPEDQRPDAAFCINDLIASGLAEVLLAGGLRIPQDIAIIGYNDTAGSMIAPLPLSSIRQPHEEFGRTAIELLVEQLGPTPATPRHVVFEPDLVIRSSTTG